MTPLTDVYDAEFCPVCGDQFTASQWANHVENGADALHEHCARKAGIQDEGCL